MRYYAVFQKHYNDKKPLAIEVALTEGGEIDYTTTDKLVKERQNNSVLGVNWTLISARSPYKAIKIASKTAEGQVARPPHAGEKFRAARMPWRAAGHQPG